MVRTRRRCLSFDPVSDDYLVSFYCIILMTAMFLSSCYWPPVPLETSLSTPWSPNITTYSEALLSLVPDIPPEIMPTEIPIVEHCWCDIASGKFFEPFNITKWEMISVERLKEEVVRRIREEDQKAISNEIGNAIANAPGVNDYDAEDLENELNNLEQEALDEQMLKTGPVPVLPTGPQTERKLKINIPLSSAAY